MRVAVQKEMEKKSDARNMRRILGGKKLQRQNHQKNNLGNVQKSSYRCIYQRKDYVEVF